MGGESTSPCFMTATKHAKSMTGDPTLCRMYVLRRKRLKGKPELEILHYDATIKFLLLLAGIIGK